MPFFIFSLVLLNLLDFGVGGCVSLLYIWHVLIGCEKK